ncbi:hypothetical protein HID58_021196 [Brassica napus]|uniref:Uncharacterized protein n=1 Tax=Brassica napus TaxID=3708 RepID=A0ABQ8CVQ9_BRANA|nr:hypothetical protein HID58_021196 [Brassica napus]
MANQGCCCWLDEVLDQDGFWPLLALCSVTRTHRVSNRTGNRIQGFLNLLTTFCFLKSLYDKLTQYRSNTNTISNHLTNYILSLVKCTAIAKTSNHHIVNRRIWFRFPLSHLSQHLCRFNDLTILNQLAKDPRTEISNHPQIHINHPVQHLESIIDPLRLEISINHRSVARSIRRQGFAHTFRKQPFSLW